MTLETCLVITQNFGVIDPFLVRVRKSLQVFIFGLEPLFGKREAAERIFCLGPAGQWETRSEASAQSSAGGTGSSGGGAGAARRKGRRKGYKRRRENCFMKIVKNRKQTEKERKNRGGTRCQGSICLDFDSTNRSSNFWRWSEGTGGEPKDLDPQ